MNINYIGLIQAAVILAAGYTLARGARTLAEKVLAQLGTIKYKKLGGQIVFYLISVLFLFCALGQLGFDLHVILGAAGIFSVAIGFASQTSASNFISGLFLIFERVISEGDTITIDDITGEVLSIDLLSTKIKTADNLFIRIPNETLIKSKLANLSRFSRRRLDIAMMLPYEQNLTTIKALWFSLLEKNVLCLKTPSPDFTVQSIVQDGVSILFSVWVEEKNYAKLKSTLQQAMLEAFSEQQLTPYVSHKFTLQTLDKHDNL